MPSSSRREHSASKAPASGKLSLERSRSQLCACQQRLKSRRGAERADTRVDLGHSVQADRSNKRTLAHAVRAAAQGSPAGRVALRGDRSSYWISVRWQVVSSVFGCRRPIQRTARHHSGPFGNEVVIKSLPHRTPRDSAWAVTATVRTNERLSASNENPGHS
jgi:hypothetical protein